VKIILKYIFSNLWLYLFVDRARTKAYQRELEEMDNIADSYKRNLKKLGYRKDPHSEDWIAPNAMEEEEDDDDNESKKSHPFQKKKKNKNEYEYESDDSFDGLEFHRNKLLQKPPKNTWKDAVTNQSQDTNKKIDKWKNHTQQDQPRIKDIRSSDNRDKHRPQEHREQDDDHDRNYQKSKPSSKQKQDRRIKDHGEDNDDDDDDDNENNEFNHNNKFNHKHDNSDDDGLQAFHRQSSSKPLPQEMRNTKMIIAKPKEETKKSDNFSSNKDEELNNLQRQLPSSRFPIKEDVDPIPRNNPYASVGNRTNNSNNNNNSMTMNSTLTSTTNRLQPNSSTNGSGMASSTTGLFSIDSLDHPPSKVQDTDELYQPKLSSTLNVDKKHSLNVLDDDGDGYPSIPFYSSSSKGKNNNNSNNSKINPIDEMNLKPVVYSQPILPKKQVTYEDDFFVDESEDRLQMESMEDDSFRQQSNMTDKYPSKVVAGGGSQQQQPSQQHHPLSTHNIEEDNSEHYSQDFTNSSLSPLKINPDDNNDGEEDEKEEENDEFKSAPPTTTTTTTNNNDQPSYDSSPSELQLRSLHLQEKPGGNEDDDDAVLFGTAKYSNQSDNNSNNNNININDIAGGGKNRTSFGTTDMMMEKDSLGGTNDQSNTSSSYYPPPSYTEEEEHQYQQEEGDDVDDDDLYDPHYSTDHYHNRSAEDGEGDMTGLSYDDSILHQQHHQRHHPRQQQQQQEDDQDQEEENQDGSLHWNRGRAPLELIELAEAFEINITGLKIEKEIVKQVKKVRKKYNLYLHGYNIWYEYQSIDSISS
jgi:hypothetical protein